MRHDDSAIALKSEAPLTSAVTRAWVELIVELGIDSDPDGLRRIAAQAVERGASPLLAEIACDTDAPMVARFRALGRITAAL